jgi:hypothetical protein
LDNDVPTAGHDLHEDLKRADDAADAAPSNRNFGLVFAGFFALLAILAWHGGRPSAPWLAAVAVLFAVVAFAAPALLTWPSRLWGKLGEGLHLVVSPIVLAIMFFGVITPVAALMRMAGHDPMRRRNDPAAASYWIVRQPPGPPPDSMRHQF